MSIRTEKVASVIVEALSDPLRKIASEINAGLITVTSVKMSPDLQIAKVYISCIGEKHQLRMCCKLLIPKNPLYADMWHMLFNCVSLQNFVFTEMKLWMRWNRSKNSSSKRNNMIACVMEMSHHKAP